MKLSELKTRTLSEATKGKWKIGNLKGVYKNFKSNDSEDALAWMKNRSSEDEASKLVWGDGYWKEDPKVWERESKKMDREDKKAEREEAKRNAGPTAKQLKDLYDEGMDAIGSSFPDGDPIDHMLRTLNRNNWHIEELDLAFKKFGHGHEKKGFYAAVAGMWDDMQPDQMHDANIDIKAGRKPERSDFYDVEDGKVVAKKNPWK